MVWFLKEETTKRWSDKVAIIRSIKLILCWVLNISCYISLIELKEWSCFEMFGLIVILYVVTCFISFWFLIVVWDTSWDCFGCGACLNIEFMVGFIFSELFLTWKKKGNCDESLILFAACMCVLSQIWKGDPWLC